jgi:catechol 2,3-dioxygenase-like lactoylglutathione lyase family enzyme
MLGKFDATVTLATKDMTAGREFYKNVLGLTETKVDDEGLSELVSGDTKLNLYPAGSADLNGGTVCTWWVGESFDELVVSLKSKGVTYEHYEGMPGLELSGDIHTLTDIKRRVVWFKDPSGNILSITDK